jgi:TonB family protein
MQRMRATGTGGKSWRARLAGIACLSLALLAGPHPASAQAPPQELVVAADVRIGADGSVADYRLDSDLDRRLAERIEREVRGWHFVPVLKDGQAVAAKTRLLLTLEPAAEYGRWTIVDVSPGQPALARRALLMPDYPLAALRAHLGARVVLVLRLDPRGKVAAVHVEQTSLNRPGDDKLAAQWRAIFEEPSVRAARGWKFFPPEDVDGQALGTSFRIPIVFVYYGDRAHRYYPGPVTPAPWLPASADDQSARDALDSGEMQPLDSRFKLQHEVAGRTL